jgi:hypothetical protein
MKSRAPGRRRNFLREALNALWRIGGGRWQFDRDEQP